MQRQCVDWALQFRLQQLVNPLMPFDLGETVELLGNDDQLEMRIGPRACMHMAFVLQLQQSGSQGVADFLFYAGCYSHGGTG
jgi:hypothetical protein